MESGSKCQLFNEHLLWTSLGTIYTWSESTAEHWRTPQNTWKTQTNLMEIHLLTCDISRSTCMQSITFTGGGGGDSKVTQVTIAILSLSAKAHEKSVKFKSVGWAKNVLFKCMFWVSAFSTCAFVYINIPILPSGTLDFCNQKLWPILCSQ